MIQTKAYEDLWANGPMTHELAEIHQQTYASAFRSMGTVGLITPEMISLKTTYHYTKEQYENFHKTLPSPKQMKAIKESASIIVAGPPHNISFRELWQRLVDRYVISGWGILENDLDEKSLLRPVISQDRTLQPRWMVMSKIVISHMPDRNIKPSWERSYGDHQRMLASTGKYSPSAAEVLWVAAATSLYEDTDLPLPQLKHVYSEYALTSTMIGSDRVAIGGFEKKGATLMVRAQCLPRDFHGTSDNTKRHHIGLAPISFL